MLFAIDAAQKLGEQGENTQVGSMGEHDRFRSGQGIVEGGVSAAVRIVEEAVDAGGIFVRSDDLAEVVDALCNGDAGGQGIVDGGVNTAA
jgi:hypothetical protein